MTLFIVVFLLICSNTFMTFAWYAHLRNFPNAPLWFVILVSWGIALFEYILMVPANRLGNGVLSLPQLKILQEAISMSVFVRLFTVSELMPSFAAIASRWNPFAKSRTTSSSRGERMFGDGVKESSAKNAVKSEKLNNDYESA